MSSLTPVSGEIRVSEFDQSDCNYEPGTPVPISGLYEICHKDEQRSMALLLRDELFLDCNRCGNKVRYKLLQAAPHVSEDPDFQTPGIA